MKENGHPVAKSRTTNSELFKQLGSVEADLGAFKAEMRTSLTGIVDNVQALRKEMAGISDHVRRPMDWKAILGGLSLIMTFTIAATRCSSQGYIDTLARLDQAHRVAESRALVRSREDGKQEEAFRQLEARTRGWESNHRAQLAATKELLAQSIEDLEHRVSNGPMHELRSRLDRAESDLRSRAGRRWNKPDQEEYERRAQRAFDDIRADVDALREATMRLRDGNAIEQRVDVVERQLTDHMASVGHIAMMERVSALAARVDALATYARTIEAKADANSDEDFKRPEAEEMRDRLERRIVALEQRN